MKEIKVDCGYRIEDNGTIEYIGGQTDNGMCYKDISAWKNGNGIIYISEYELEDLENGINHTDLWTRETWLAWVEEYLKGNDLYYKNGCAEFIASIVLEECDWQCLSILLEEIDIEEYIKSFLNDKLNEYIVNNFNTRIYSIETTINRIDEYRCDLKTADYQVYCHIQNLIDDFIYDYELDEDFVDNQIYDIEDIFFNVVNIM